MEKRYKFNKKDHFHSLDGRGLIGTSGVGNVIAKPLTWWASGLAVRELGIHDPKILTKIRNKTATNDEIKKLHELASIKHEEIKKMSIPEFVNLLDCAYRAHNTTLKEKGEEGTDLHAELEKFIKFKMKGEIKDNTYFNQRILPFIDWYEENVEKVLWSEGHCYSEIHWLGGISDFGFIDKKGQTAIMDFKSSKEAYPTQFWQCSGYDIQISENGVFTPEGDRIVDPGLKFDYYAVLPFGAAKPTPVLEYDVGGCKSAFLAMLLLYKKLPHNN